MSSKLEQYHVAYAASQAARQALLDATKAAWPIGMRVISNKFYTGPIACTVAGYRDYGTDAGSVVLLNDRTGKTHRAWPHSYHMGVWGVVPADTTEPKT